MNIKTLMCHEGSRMADDELTYDDDDQCEQSCSKRPRWSYDQLPGRDELNRQA